MTDHAPPSAELMIEYVEDLFTVYSPSHTRAHMRTALREWIRAHGRSQPADDEAGITMEEAARMRDQAVMHARKDWYRADRSGETEEAIIERMTHAIVNADAYNCMQAPARDLARAAYAALQGG